MVAAERPEFGGVHAALKGHGFGGEGDECRFIGLAPPRHGRKIGAVGFDHQAVRRDAFHGFAQVVVGGIGHGAGDGNVPAVGKETIKKSHGVAAEAVPQHGAS